MKMKNLSSIILFVSVFFVSLNIESQNTDRLPVMRNRIAQAKLNEIQRNLGLSEADFNLFRPIYLRYESEISRIDFRNQAKLSNIEADSLSAEQADNLIMSQFKNSRKLINIRERYYQEFRTVLTPQQVIKLYQTEKGFRNKVIAERKKRMMNRKVY
jgi:hypothetical protein